jgi:RNA polymerase sigma-70 factor (ECF subfamily)
VELIGRARAGDRAALNELFLRYVPPLRRWAGGRLPRWARDVVDTDDMIQETLLHTIRNLERFEPRREGALLAYLRQALRRRVLDELRRAHRRPAAVELGQDQRDRAASPLERAIGQEALERYERALLRLSEGDREAVLCRVELGLDYGRIAETLGKPSPDAARMAVSRALVRLAREMGDEG